MLLFRKFSAIFLCLSLLLTLSPVASAAGDPLDRVVFFGDSTTAHLAVRGGIPKSRVWSGVKSTVLFESVNETKCVYLSAEGKSMTLSEAVALKKPAVLVITLGVSGGAGVMPMSRFTEIYRRMLLSVKKASPGTKVVVQSILPLSDKASLHYKSLTKASVLEANRAIRGLCADLGVPYIDTHSLLCDASGYLKKEYQNDEYMHLTAKAYTVVLQNIRKQLISLGY